MLCCELLLGYMKQTVHMKCVITRKLYCEIMIFIQLQLMASASLLGSVYVVLATMRRHCVKQPSTNQ